MSERQASTFRKGQLEDRFWAKVRKTESCWIWEASTDPYGYGSFRLDGINRPAHKVAYIWAKGPVPEGKELDHLCRNPACVNPEHLQAITHAENIRRGYALRTHCPQGHPLAPGNLVLGKYAKGKRECLICSKIRGARWRAINKEKKRAMDRAYYLKNAERIKARARAYDAWLRGSYLE